MNKKRAGFTLIELLVVIAIIALLLAIIMPSFQKVKLIAREVLCKSNIRQYGIATELYSNENHEFFPNPWESLYSKYDFLNEGGKRYCRWHNAEYDLSVNANAEDTDGTKYAGPYWQYLAVTKANVCPTFAGLKKYGDKHENHDPSIPIDGPFFSYSMNANIKKKGSDTEGNAEPARISKITSPSEVFLWGEEDMWPMNFATPRNISGVSGSVTIISGSSLNDNALLIDEDGYGRDSFGSYHGLSSGEINSQQPPVSNKPGTFQESGFTHALMIDGSLRKVSPLDNLYYAGKYNGY